MNELRQAAEDALLPCPLCGYPAEVVTTEEIHYGHGDRMSVWRVDCTNVGECELCLDHMSSRKAAMAVWNRRAASAGETRADGTLLREQLAEYAHTSWSNWMKWMFKKGFYRNQELEGHVQAVWVMPLWARQRWERQMNTPYDKLPEEEKESDRLEADRMIEIFDRCPRVAAPDDDDVDEAISAGFDADMRYEKIRRAAPAGETWQPVADTEYSVACGCGDPTHKATISVFADNLLRVMMDSETEFAQAFLPPTLRLCQRISAPAATPDEVQP